MTPKRFQEISSHYADLRIAVIGDFCLDRYLEIDPGRAEVSIETGLPVHNVMSVRAQPGGAGTILNNLFALRVGDILPVGFCGEDGEGWELRQALRKGEEVNTHHFFQTELRRTFTYCKPLLMGHGRAPVELNRLDSKNWTPTPALVEGRLVKAIEELAPQLNGIVVLDQVSLPETGVVTRAVLQALERVMRNHPDLPVLADSRSRLADFPNCAFKLNRAEFCQFAGLAAGSPLEDIKDKARAVALHQRRNVFATLAEEGILGAASNGEVAHVPAHPLRGEIDIVGAGDAVTANLIAAWCAGAMLDEALEIASAAASIVIHQLGTTGTATPAQIRELLERGKNV
jgi:rfaE bifunctional protein kinase chain/domain